MMLRRLAQGPTVKMLYSVSSAVPCPLVHPLTSATPVSAFKTNGLSTADLPPANCKQPAWKPYIYKGKQRFLIVYQFLVRSTLGRLRRIALCFIPLDRFSHSLCGSIVFHPCAQIPEQGGDKQLIMFSPLLGNFTLALYQASCGMPSLQ